MASREIPVEPVRIIELCGQCGADLPPAECAISNNFGTQYLLKCSECRWSEFSTQDSGRIEYRSPKEDTQCLPQT